MDVSPRDRTALVVTGQNDARDKSHAQLESTLFEILRSNYEPGATLRAAPAAEAASPAR